MTDATIAAPPTDPTAPAPNATPSGPAAGVTAPPGTALDIANMLAAGTIDAAQAGKLAKAGGLSTLNVAHALHTLREMNDPKPDARSPEAIKLDEEFGPVAAPHEFVIRWDLPGEKVVMTPDQRKQADTQARNWLTEAGFPLENGNALVSAITKVGQATKDMTPAQLEQYGYDQYQLLERAHGDRETLEKRLVRAGEMVEALEKQHPGLKKLLKSSGVGDTALIANMLISQSEIFWARRKGR